MNLPNRLFGLLLAACLFVTPLLAAGCNGNDDGYDDGSASSLSPSDNAQTQQNVPSDTGSASSGGTISLPLQTQEEKLSGEWEATWELSDFLNSVISRSDEELGNYLRVTDFALPVRFAFQTDGTYTFSPDEDALDRALSSVREQFRAGYTRYFLDSADGYEITVEDILSSIGYRSMDAYLDDVMSGFDLLSDSLRSSGHWSASDGKLFLRDRESDVEDGRYAVYTLENDALTIQEWDIKSIEGVGESDMKLLRKMFDKLFPLEFSRIL